jgi:flagellar hook-length control protein FliK
LNGHVVARTVIMPLIAPVLPTPAVPPPEGATAAAASASQGPSAPRFSDALSRAGLAQSTPSGASNPSSAQSQSGGKQPTEAGAQKPASTDDATKKSQAKTDDPQQPTPDPAADHADAAALALQIGGALQAATVPGESGKNLPQGGRKPDANEVASAAPGQAQGMLLPVPQAARSAMATPTDAPSQTRATPAVASPPIGQKAALQSVLATSAPDNDRQGAQLKVRPGGALAFAGHLPAWLQGMTASGAGVEQPGRFAVLQAQSATAAEAATLNSAQSSRADHATPAIALSTLPQSIALALPQMTYTPQAAMTAAVHPPVGSPDWGQAMNQHILFAAQGQQQFATLHLNPPQLGPLEVHLQVHDGQIQAQFVSPHAVVRQAVEAALPQLRDLFTGAGLSLMQTSVSTQGGQGGRQQQAWAQRSAPDLSAIGGAATEPAGAMAVSPQRWQQGLVNTYV